MFTFDPTSQGYEYVSVQANHRVGRDMQESDLKTERADNSLYVKTSIHAAQKDYMTFTAFNLTELNALAQTNFMKRTKDSDPFALEPFAFVTKRSVPVSAIRSATASRVQAARVIGDFLSER